MKISLAYPKNIIEKDKCLFDSILDYKVKIPVVKKVKNVFVSYEGLFLQKMVLLKSSAFNLSGKKDINFYWKYWRLVAEQFLVSKFGKSLVSEYYKDGNYAIVHTKWFNYAFWINDSINRCVLLEKSLRNDEFVLLVPESLYEITFVKDTLSAFNFNIELIPKDTHCFISNCFLPQTRQYTASFDPISVQQIREKLIPIALKKSKIGEYPSKIYLSRRERGVRSLSNELEVEETLIACGFTILSFENLSVWDQIAYMYHTNWFVANHGAGFSNILFMKPGNKVLEFLEYDFAHYGNPFPHWRLSTIVQLNYYYLFGVSNETQYIPYVKNRMTTSKKRMQLVNREIKVDICALKKIVNG